MNINLTPKIIDGLQHRFEMQVQGKYLRGRCPECGKKTLWTWHESPGVIQCSRLNNCAYSEPTKDVFPELFENLNKKYKPTDTNPNATADAYLQLIRGFDTSKIKGWYEQGFFTRKTADKTTATVRFYLNNDRGMMWERLIEDVTLTDRDGELVTRNKNFEGTFKGYWWQPPTLNITENDEIWLCEGILDAIALNLNGIKAVSIMSSMTFPEISIKPYLGKNITWIIATDNDNSGRDALEKHVNILTDMGEAVYGAMSSDGERKADWNDLHYNGKLTDEDIKRYRYFAALALAPSALEKARLMYEFNPARKYFIYAFKNRSFKAKIDSKILDTENIAYWAGVARKDAEQLNNDDVKKIEAEATEVQRRQCKEHCFKAAAKINEIATFRMHYLYFQLPDSGEDGQYFFSFRMHNSGQERQISFTHKTLSAASDFKKSCMRIPGALFGGDSADLDWLYREWSLNNTKEVRVLDFIGYDKITKSYVFNDYAVSNGKVIPVNKESFFQLKKSGIKTSVDIKQTLSEKPSVNWHDDFKVAFGTKGIITLAWWLGSLFAEQVREQHRSYPFFELIGEASSGKSSLVDFLWKLLGKDSETFNPNTSTPAGRQRKMAEVANIPIAFNETDNENEGRNSHAKRFNWDELKDLFEGEFGRVTGIKSQDNTTKKPKFKSTLIIVQNIPVVASEAILSRIVHTNFDRSHHSEQGYEASIRLNSLEIDAVNGFLLKTLRQEPQIMQCFNQQFSLHRRKLEANKNIKLPRIVDTHAKIMAFADCLAELMPSFKTDINEVHKELASMAEERQQALNQDTQLVQQFWSMVEYLDTRTVFKTSHYKQASTEDRLDDDQPENSPPTENAVNSSSQLNHSTKPQQEWAINIEHFIQQCGIHNLSRFNTEELRELRRQLPSSKKYKFEGNKPVRSRIEGRTVRCYVFSKTTTK